MLKLLKLVDCMLLELNAMSQEEWIISLGAALEDKETQAHLGSTYH